MPAPPPLKVGAAAASHEDHDDRQVDQDLGLPADAGN
jgi:hypothetical protein